jgi:hypothetical protein
MQSLQLKDPEKSMQRSDIIKFKGRLVDLSSIKSLREAGVAVGSNGIRLVDPSAAIDDGRKAAFEALRNAATKQKQDAHLDTKD